MNSRLDELQAALLLAKLPHLEEWVAERRRIAALYEAGLRNPKIRLLAEDAGKRIPYFPGLYGRGAGRAAQPGWRNLGIHCLIHYPMPIHLQKAYRDLGYQRGDFPRRQELAETELSLPLYPGMTEEQISTCWTC